MVDASLLLLDLFMVDACLLLYLFTFIAASLAGLHEGPDHRVT